MSNPAYNSAALRNSANLSINIGQVKRSQWLAENRDALDAYNRRVGKRGAFSDSLRRF